LTIKNISKALNLSEEDTEVCVVKAIQNGDLDAKIDQIEGSVFIASLNETFCRKNEWDSIEKGLSNFKNLYSEFAEVLKAKK